MGYLWDMVVILSQLSLTEDDSLRPDNFAVRTTAKNTTTGVSKRVLFEFKNEYDQPFDEGKRKTLMEVLK